MHPESIEFRHYQSAHCESGVTSNLLQYEGVPISEAMAFGIGSGIFFVYLPWVKVMGLPLTSYRSFPGGIFKKTCRRLGIPFAYRRFGDPLKGARALDTLLVERGPVGIRGNIYWLPYIPEKFRFQFNAHNFVVYGKSDTDTYQVSDPVLEQTTLCPARALNKSRFAKGALAPKGLIFYATPKAGADLPWEHAIKAGLRETVQRMLFSPVPFAGSRGIHFLSRQIAKWPRTIPDLDQRKLYLANVVRMQEEIGTGGAGFRFLFAAFLQEAGERLDHATLRQASVNITDVGNLWRDFATLSAKFCKDRLEGPFVQIPELLGKIGEQERLVFQDLRRNYL